MKKGILFTYLVMTTVFLNFSSPRGIRADDRVQPGFSTIRSVETVNAGLQKASTVNLGESVSISKSREILQKAGKTVYRCNCDGQCYYPTMLKSQDGLPPKPVNNPVYSVKVASGRTSTTQYNEMKSAGCFDIATEAFLTEGYSVICPAAFYQEILEACTDPMDMKDHNEKVNLMLVNCAVCDENGNRASCL